MMPRDYLSRICSLELQRLGALLQAQQINIDGLAVQSGDNP